MNQAAWTVWELPLPPDTKSEQKCNETKDKKEVSENIHQLSYVESSIKWNHQLKWQEKS